MRTEETGGEGHGELEGRFALQVGGVEVQVALTERGGRRLGSNLLWTWLTNSCSAAGKGSC
jgi:hypothetical protein